MLFKAVRVGGGHHRCNGRGAVGATGAVSARILGSTRRLQRSPSLSSATADFGCGSSATAETMKIKGCGVSLRQSGKFGGARQVATGTGVKLENSAFWLHYCIFANIIRLRLIVAQICRC
jgi:hypothetical protein